MESNFLKPNFIGRDKFIWWIGQIPPATVQAEQLNGEGWGNRYKVRILGYHPNDETELPNDDLPWAQCMLPVTAGSGGANYATTTQIKPGDVVIGFFMDSDNAQIPIIMGCLGRTEQVWSGDYQSPWIPYTGFTNNISKKDSLIVPNENNDKNAGSLPSPINASPEVVSRLNQTAQKEGKAANERSFYGGIGQEVVFANTCDDTVVNGITAEVNNLLNTINNAANLILNIPQEIARTVDKILAMANGIVGQLFNSLYNELIGLLKKGLDLLYKAVFAKVLAVTGNGVIAHAAGVAAQTAMVHPVKVLEEALICVASKVVNGLGGMISDLLRSVIDNVKNFVTCAGTQFAGSFINGLINEIVSGLSGPLGGVAKILSLAFNIFNFLRSGINIIKAIGGLFDCNQNKNKCSGLIRKHTIGQGLNSTTADGDLFDKILDGMNTAAAKGKENKNSLFEQKYGSWDIYSPQNSKPNSSGCYTGEFTSCNPPVVKIFGGGGSGGTANALLGSFVSNTPNLSEVVDSTLVSASIIGVSITNSGSGYKYPPFVEFYDNCGQGYGAIARSIITDTGEIESIYMVSVGENYPVSEIDQEYIVSDVVVQAPGQNYSSEDTATDNFKNEYTLLVNDGRIIAAKVINSTNITNDGRIIAEKVINSTKITSLPIIKISTKTGMGAILKPSLKLYIDQYPTQVKSVIDCID